MENYWLSGVQIGELIYLIKQRKSKSAMGLLNKIAITQKIKIKTARVIKIS